MYETEHEQLTKTVPLYGPDFIIDNGNVYDILKGVILAGPAWPWMQEHNKKRDGHKAWKSLITHYEGDTVINRNRKLLMPPSHTQSILGTGIISPSKHM